MERKKVIGLVLVACCLFVMSGAIVMYMSSGAGDKGAGSGASNGTSGGSGGTGGGSSSGTSGVTSETPKKTVREQLQAVCPKDPAAGDKINVGNTATYDDYLFSGCTAANACSGYEPDAVSQAILKKTEHCGAWVLNSTGYSYSPESKWTPIPSYFTLKHGSGACVHPQGGATDPSNGTKAVYHQGCSGDGLQFSMTSGGSLKHKTSGKCLHAYDNSFPNNTPVVFYAGCDEERLKWEFTPGGSLRHVKSGKCVHPQGGSGTPADNTVLVLHEGCDEDRLRVGKGPI